MVVSLSYGKTAWLFPLWYLLMKLWSSLNKCATTTYNNNSNKSLSACRIWNGSFVPAEDNKDCRTCFLCEWKVKLCFLLVCRVTASEQMQEMETPLLGIWIIWSTAQWDLILPSKRTVNEQRGTRKADELCRMWHNGNILFTSLVSNLLKSTTTHFIFVSGHRDRSALFQVRW